MKRFGMLIMYVLLASAVAGSAFAGLNDGMVGYYSFNDCTAADNSGTGNNGTIVGNAQCVTGVTGSALQFGGYSAPGYVTVPNSPSLTFLDNYTFTVWFNIQSYSSMDGWGNPSDYGFETLFAKAGDRNGLDLRTSRATGDSAFTFYAYSGWCCGGSGGLISSVDKFNLNEWHMATVTSGNGEVKLYLDCALQGSLPTDQFNVNPVMQNMPLQFGIDQSATWYPIDGMLDEARVYDRALSDQEVKELYKSAGFTHCPGENQIPTANAGPDQTVELTSCGGAAVALDGSASSDPDGDSLTYAWTWPGGSASGPTPVVTLPYGDTTVTLSVDDGKGGVATDSVVVHVVDTTPPALSVSLNPGKLWPPNHKYVTVTPIITVSDACDAWVTVELVSVSSNEPDEGLGDGDTSRDIRVNADGTISLRAERSGRRSGRTYTVTYRATDKGGNSTLATATVTIPHDRRECGEHHKSGEHHESGERDR